MKPELIKDKVFKNVKFDGALVKKAERFIKKNHIVSFSELARTAIKEYIINNTPQKTIIKKSIAKDS